MRNIKLYEEWELDIKALINNEYTYFDAVKSSLIDILMDEKEISEKDFSNVDNLVKYVNTMFENNREVIKIYDDCNANKKRASYCAEIIYDEIFTSEQIKMN